MAVVQQLEIALRDVNPVLRIGTFLHPQLDRDRIHLQTGCARHAGGAALLAIKADRQIAAAAKGGRLPERVRTRIHTVVVIPAGVRHRGAAGFIHPPVGRRTVRQYRGIVGLEGGGRADG